MRAHIVIELPHASEEGEDGAAEGGRHDGVPVGAVGVGELAAFVPFVERERLRGRRPPEDSLVSHVRASQIDNLRPVRPNGRVAGFDHL